MTAVTTFASNGGPLSNTQLDTNFTNLNAGKVELVGNTQKVGGVNSSNLIMNGSGELGMLGWSDPLGIISSSANLLGDGNLFTNVAIFNSNFLVQGNQVPVGPAVNLTLQAEVDTSNMASGSVGIRLDCYQSNGSFISSINSMTVMSGTTYAPLVGTAPTPALTAYVVPVMFSTGVAANQPALSVKIRRIKGEQGTTPSLYANEASIAALWAQLSSQIQRGQCYLRNDTATPANVTLYRSDGEWLMINGVMQQIPANGVTLAGAGAAASTQYYIYAYMNNGVMTLERSTTVFTGGSDGTAIKTGDPTRSLVGMAYCATAGSFAPGSNNYLVASYYNRKMKVVVTSTAGGGTSSPSTYTDFVSAALVAWASEIVYVNCYASVKNATVSTQQAVVKRNSTILSNAVAQAVLQGNTLVSLYPNATVQGSDNLQPYSASFLCDAGQLIANNVTLTLMSMG